MSSETTTPPIDVPLTTAEARILGCLVEKQATTPEVYPLTLNALVLACNQKTSREPLMNLTAGQVGQGLRSLEGRGLARLVMGSRADRWEHRADKALELVAAQVVLIGLLLLRGPQTVNELLTQAGQREDRYMPLLGDPADLQAIMDASASHVERPAGSAYDESRLDALEARVAELEERLARLE